MGLSKWGQHGTTMRLLANAVATPSRDIIIMGIVVGNQVEVQSQ